MSIKKLNEHYSFTNPASIYDEESMTALELAGRQAKKINEVIESQNKLDADTKETLKQFRDEDIPHQTHNAVQEHIDNGVFDHQIDQSLGNLKERVDNLARTVTPGTTSADAEIIEARLRPRTSESAGNLYSNIWLNYFDSMSLRAKPEPEYLDANLCVGGGYYWVSSGEPWKNVPLNTETGGIIGGYLACFNDDGYGSLTVNNTHSYQLFFASDSNIYFRTGRSDSFNAWEKIPCISNVLAHINNATTPLKNALNNDTMRLKYVPENNTLTANIRDNGAYYLSSSIEWEDLPDGEPAGLLMCYHGLNDYSVYHILFSFSGSIYYRNCNNDTTFKEWEKIPKLSEISVSTTTSNSEKYSVRKIGQASSDGDTEILEIHQKTKTGEIVYYFGDNDFTGNKRLYYIQQIIVDSETGAEVERKTIVNTGHDIEGVINVRGGFYGGVHGCETVSDCHIYVNGTDVTDIPVLDNVTCDHVLITKSSRIENSIDGVDCYRIVKIIFDNDGVHIYNYISTDSVDTILYGGMMSVYKSVCGGYMTENDYSVNFYQGEIEEDIVYGDNQELRNDSVSFIGDDIVITHKCDDYNYMTLHNYVDRFKTYYSKNINSNTANCKMSSHIKIEG